MKLGAVKNVLGLGVDEEGATFELKLKARDVVLLFDGAFLLVFHIQE